jgi:hypothetical protein
MFARMVSDHQWAAQRVATLPRRWQRRVLGSWERARQDTPEGEPHRAANLGLLGITDQLNSVRLPLDATDAEICDRADTQARRCFDAAQLYHEETALHAAMVRVCEGQGVTPPRVKRCKDVPPAIARMVCPLWWRRQLRRVHAKNVEGAAIFLGLVHKRADPYVSAESLERRQQQNRRNADALEATIARNEEGQEFTLAELAAKGPANKAIRRAELMTRISGFERIAKDMGHAGLFFTITCPSRMHKWRTVNKGAAVVENRRYDGTNPREAQAYLAKVWARIRAALKRQGIGLYGFRIAEPNHDGTPHWHLLAFHAADQLQALRAVILKHALKDSPTEPGALEHRVDFKPIDWTRGSAAGYIAKYVAKNIDGYGIEKDLLGNDAITTAARVEAWASTWGIRQFQQVGGPPVGPWRELRRVESVPEQAPQHLKDAHNAVNRHGEAGTELFKAAAWDAYCKAQGGVFVGRQYRIRIATVEVEALGRYGEQKPPRPVGVETESREIYTPAHMRHMNPPGQALRVVSWFVESSRHVWEIVKRTARDASQGLARAIGAAWTRVNNCTERVQDGRKIGAPDGAKQAARGADDGPGNLGQGPGPRASDRVGFRGAFAGGS